MNLEQIVRKARFEVDAIRASGATSQLWSDEEVRDAVNDAMDTAARIIRLAGSDLLTTTLRSTDSAADYITEIYDPAVLQLADGVTDYTLPPDLVSIVNILPITDNFDGVHFYPAESTGRLYTDQRTLQSDDLHSVEDGIMSYLYTQIGARTLRLAPMPRNAIDIELVYRYRPPRLFTFDEGTLTIAAASTALTGSAGEWYTAGIRLPAEVIAPADGVISLNRVYPRISVLSADGSATMARGWQGDELIADTDWAISMVPTLPEEHHQWLAKMTASILLRKVNIDISDKSRAYLEQQLTEQVRPELTMRQVQESIPVEPFNPGG